jgi:hypothetical protein
LAALPVVVQVCGGIRGAVACLPSGFRPGLGAFPVIFAAINA